ncbi:MAG: LVIVD repeat-containing protein [Promethearchaeota archaeon]
MRKVRKKRNILVIFGIFTIIASSFNIQLVRSEGWEDVPIKETTWVMANLGGGNVPTLFLNEDILGGYQSYSSVPLRIERDGQALVEMVSDGGISTYKISENLESIEGVIFGLYTPGLVEQFAEYPYLRYERSKVHDFLLMNGKMAVVSFEPLEPESTINTGTLRLFARDGNYQYYEISHFNDNNLTSDNFGNLNALNIKENYLFVIGEDHRFWTFDVSNWNQPTIIKYITLDSSDLGKTTFLEIDGNYAYTFDGYKTIEIVNITDPTNPAELDFNITAPGIVHDIKAGNNRLYVSAGKKGLYVYNISDPTDIALLDHYDDTIQDLFSACIVDTNHIFIGNENGSVQYLEISDLGIATLINSWNSFNCSTLMYDNSLLFVGTFGNFQQIYDVTDPLDPTYKFSTSQARDEEGGSNQKFEWLCVFNMGGESDCKAPTLENHITYTAEDGDGIVRLFDSIIWIGYLLLYNDTNGDGMLSYNVERDPDVNELVTSVSITDEVYAYPVSTAQSYSYTDPEIKLYDGEPAIQFNMTYYDWEMRAEESTLPSDYNLRGFPDEIDIVQNGGLNVTFDLTYSFWLIPKENDDYNIKIDTLIQNINLDFDGAPIPSNLKFFTGYLIDFATTFGHTGMSISTSLSEADSSQDFMMRGGLIGENFLNNWYVKNNSNVLENSECLRCSIPNYRDPDCQEIIGDSEHVYSFVVGANLDVNSTITDLYYDPETRFYCSYLPVEQDPGLESVIPIVGGIVGVVVAVIFIRKLKGKKKINSEIQ